MEKVLEELDNQPSTMGVTNDEKNETRDIEGVGIQEQFNAVREKIMIWVEGSYEGFDYLNAVDDAGKLIQRLENSCFSEDGEEKGGKELLRMTRDLLQMSMPRLKEQFCHMLASNKQLFEADLMSFRSSEEDVFDSNSIVSSSSNSFSIISNHVTNYDVIIDLVDYNVIPNLRCMVNVMFMANYEHECLQAYVPARKNALDKCLYILGMVNVSRDDVLKMELGKLSLEIKRWICAIKTFVRVHLISEKWLSHQIFQEFGQVSSKCVAEASMASMLQMLNFGKAISIRSHQPENLICLLDMYELLADLSVEVDSLYNDEASYTVKTEYHEVLRSLGNSVRGTFSELAKAVALDTTVNTSAGGGVHTFTQYVMTYLRRLSDYSDTLNLLFENDIMMIWVYCYRFWGLSQKRTATT